MADFQRPVHALFGIPIDAVTLPQAAGRLEHARRAGDRCFLTTPNLDILLQARREAGLHRSILRSDLSIADGMPLVWLARLAGAPVPERVSGSGLFDWLRRESTSPWRVFFFGGGPQAGERASAALDSAPGGMRGCGALYPGFGSVEEMSQDEWIGQINASQADFVVVSLGAAKGQAWIEHNLHRLEAPVVSHLGAVVNFVAGSVRRAPAWMQRSGLEWVWRLREEPRLARRYAGNAAGLAALLLTRALPLALLRVLAERFLRAGPQAAVVDLLAGVSVIRLGGPARRGARQDLREGLARVVERQGAVVLDLAGVRWIDSGQAGLLLLLQGELAAQQRRFALCGASPLLRLLLWLQGVAIPAGARH